MKGIQYVIDENGLKKAVLIDLTIWGEAWEDIFDAMVSKSREDEPTISWKELKAEIKTAELVDD